MSDNGDNGIWLAAIGAGTISGNMIQENVSTGNTGNGFESMTGTGVNTFQDNQSTLNTESGYSDIPVPVNIYIGYFCDFNVMGGSSPAGLCGP